MASRESPWVAGPQTLASPVDGEVEELGAGHIGLRAAGVGLVGRIGWGQPVHGRLMLGVSSPDAELRASAIDIAAAGSILVAGARLDIEALTRARAIGVAGIICGGLVGRELRQLEESDQRQRAALHSTTPFAVIALDGYGRRVRAGARLGAAGGGCRASDRTAARVTTGGHRRRPDHPRRSHP